MCKDLPIAMGISSNRKWDLLSTNNFCFNPIIKSISHQVFVTPDIWTNCQWQELIFFWSDFVIIILTKITVDHQYAPFLSSPQWCHFAGAYCRNFPPHNFLTPMQQKICKFVFLEKILDIWHNFCFVILPNIVKLNNSLYSYFKIIFET